jgi:hypothetical protein
MRELLAAAPQLAPNTKCHRPLLLQGRAMDSVEQQVTTKDKEDIRLLL